MKLLAQREAEAAARPIPHADARRRSARAADGTRRGGRGRQAHGLTLLRRAVQQLGARPLDQALDPGSPVGKALAEWRAMLIADLGADGVTAPRQGIGGGGVSPRLVEAGGGVGFQQRRRVNGGRAGGYPVVVQRQRLADGRVRRRGRLVGEDRAPQGWARGRTPSGTTGGGASSRRGEEGAEAAAGRGPQGPAAGRASPPEGRAGESARGPGTGPGAGGGEGRRGGGLGGTSGGRARPDGAGTG